VSGESLPLSIVIGPGDEHDSRRFTEVIDSIRVKHGVGRPRSRPKEIHADSAYDTKEIRRYLRRRGIKASIDINPRNTLKLKRGRQNKLKSEAYRRMRGCVERFFAWLKGGFRRLAIRYEKLASTFLGLIQIACVMIYLRVFR